MAIAYRLRMNPNASVVVEALRVQSDRAARALIGEAPEKTERSLTASIRWQF